MVVTYPRKGIVEVLLLDQVEDIDNGEWVNLTGLRSFDVEVTGVDGDTVHLCFGYNSREPAADAHGIQVGEDIEQDTVVSIKDRSPEWVKARVSTHSSGVITAKLTGRRL